MKNRTIIATLAASALLLTGATAAAATTVSSWEPGFTASCEAVTFNHPQFKVSTSPVYTLQTIGTGGVVLSEFATAVPYSWGEVITVATPDPETDARYRVILRAANPALSGAMQQIGTVDAYTVNCAPVIEPEPEEPKTDEPPVVAETVPAPKEEAVTPAPQAPIAVETAAAGN